jgi:hypothetical protein
MALRGVSLPTATTIVADIGEWQIRRDSPLSGNGIKCQDWFVEVNLKPLKGEVP